MIGDFLLAPACCIRNVGGWEGLSYLMSRLETDESVVRDKGSLEPDIEPVAPDPDPIH